MTQQQKHNRRNRARRIPRRIRELLTEIKSVDGRVHEIENSETMLPELKEKAMSLVRKSSGPLHSQVRALIARADELAIAV